MKTVSFQQQTYEVPNWANYIARDADGDVCAYELEPKYENWHGGMWVCKNDLSEWKSVTPVVDNVVVACEAI